MIYTDSILNCLSYRDKLDLIYSKYLDISIPYIPIVNLYYNNDSDLTKYTLITLKGFKIEKFKMLNKEFPIADKYGRVKLNIIDSDNTTHKKAVMFSQYARSWWVTKNNVA